jgi:hypothetical protein
MGVGESLVDLTVVTRNLRDFKLFGVRAFDPFRAR